MNSKKTLLIAVIALVIITLVLTLLGVYSSRTAPTEIKPLAIQSWQSKSGAKVMYVYAPQLPMVDIRLVFDAGSARDGNLPGLAMMTNAILDLGAGDWTTDQVAERFDSVGAQFSNSSMKDMAIFSLRSLTETAWLDQAVTTLNTILTRPRFDEGEMQRLRGQLLVSLRNQQQSPGTIAEQTFFQALYKDHPYATPEIGTVDSINAISRDDLQAFYKKYYVAANAVVAIVGDLDRKQAQVLVEKVLKGMPRGEHAAALPEPLSLEKAGRIHKSHPSTQTHILVGQPGMKRGDEDYLALYVGNHILGGSGFGSRIVEEIREKRGLAYSSYSYFTPMRVAGPFTMGLQTGNGNTDEALKILDQVLRNFIDTGPTEAELEHAKKNITGGFALRIDSNKDIIGYLGMIGFYNLPLDYLETFNARVEKISAQQIRDAFQRRVNPDKLVTVTVGQDQSP